MNIGDKFSCLLDPRKCGAIVRLITTCGEADVFEVLVNGKPAALKLFFAGGSTAAREAHCRWLAEEGPPHPAFVYPDGLIRTADGRLGILMPLIPENFHEAAMLAGLPDEERPSLRNTVKAGVNTCFAYRDVIRSGFIYVDGSGRQILVSATGAVKICDVTNIVDQVTPAFNLCTFRYTAPELWLGKTLPSVATGRYSLAVVLFEMLCGGHPLYGRRLPRILGPDDESHALHVAPLFVFDPQDDSNSPDPLEHAEVLAYWPILTTKVRELFTQQFTIGLREPNRRAIEIEWIDALYDMYTACFCCLCGAEAFHDPSAAAQVCWHCKHPLPRPARLKFANRREVVLGDGALVTRYDVTGRESYDFTPVGRIIGNALAPGSVELENLSRTAWTWRRGTGPEVVVLPGQKAALYCDAKVSFFPGSTAAVVA